MSPSELLQKVGELFVTHQAVPKPSMSLSSHGTHRVAASASAPHCFLQPFFTFLHCFLDSVVLHVLNSALQASLQSPKFLATSVSDKHGNGSAGGEGATAAGGGGAGDDEGGGGDGAGGGGDGGGNGESDGGGGDGEGGRGEGEGGGGDGDGGGGDGGGGDGGVEGGVIPTNWRMASISAAWAACSASISAEHVQVDDGDVNSGEGGGGDGGLASV